MKFDDLTPEQQERYDKLENLLYNSKKKFSYEGARKKLGYSHMEALFHYSRMLKFHTTPVITAPAIGIKPAPEPVALSATCPTCGRSKAAITTTDECRDVFHYL